MAVRPGTRLGPYEILSAIGAGGMGEVYKARDIKLGRDVALKVLPASFTDDPDRLARFRREAQVLASLNHSHIAQIHGIDEANSPQFLVLEFVDGETLGDRIKRGPLPIDEALTFAKQIAEALEAAHEKGIIHRDLKPANIALTKDSNVKVLDFGLAKATEVAGDTSLDVTNSPTIPITLPAMMTGAAVILGTAAYMSPEQAKGRAADKRSDVWAFGCVLYEMLVGRQLYSGDTAPETLARVIEREADLNALPAVTPQSIRGLLSRCLTKDPHNRLQAIGEARIVLEHAIAHVDAGSATPESAGNAASAAAPAQLARFAQRALPWLIAVVTVVSAVLMLWAPWRTQAPRAPVRLSADVGVEGGVVLGLGAEAILSPDGAQLAFVKMQRPTGTEARPTFQIYIRRLDQLQATPLAGTKGARMPFFSPDGQWVAFFADLKLKKTSVTGSAVVVLCDAPEAFGGAWSEDGTIVLAFGPRKPGLFRVSSAGGKPEELTTLDNDEAAAKWPQMLPGGKAVLYTSYRRSPDGSRSTTRDREENVFLVVQPLPTGPSKIVHRGGYYGRYASSGHLLYVHEGTLFAAPFDIARLEKTGPPVPALESVFGSIPGGAEYAFSSNGTLVYFPDSVSRGELMSWMDRTGKTSPLRSAAAHWGSVRFAPDGRRLAFDMSDNDEQPDVWVYEWARDTPSRLTFDPSADIKPVWTPDGRRIVFASTRGDKVTFNLYWQRADGTGDTTRLTDSKNNQSPASWHPSGKFLAFTRDFQAVGRRHPDEFNGPVPRIRAGGRDPGSRGQSDAGANADLMILPMEGDEVSGWKPGTPTVFLSTPFNESEPMFSPDGRWIAYVSDETGRDEIYVRPFPGPGGKWQISISGGALPIWSRAKNELFYLNDDNRLMAASYTAEGESFRAEKPRLWTEVFIQARGTGRHFDLHPDGERLVVPTSAPQTNNPGGRLVFVFNFFDELRRIAPAK